MNAVRWLLGLAALACAMVVAVTASRNAFALLGVLFLLALGATYLPRRRSAPADTEQGCPCLVDHAESEECDEVVAPDVLGWVVVERRPDRDLIVSAAEQWTDILVTRERAETAAARLNADRARRAARNPNDAHYRKPYVYFAAPVERVAA